MRKLLIAVGIFVVLVVAGVAMLPRLVDVNRYHSQIQAKVSAALKRPVTLGRMELKVFPPSIRVQNAVIGEDPAFRTGRPFAAAEELHVRAELLPLLRKKVRITAIELRNPVVELVRNQQGIWNFASLGQDKPSPAHTQPPAAPGQTQPVPVGQQPSQAGVSIEDLTITNGTVAVTDLQQRTARQVYENIDLAIEGYGPNRTFDIELAADLPGAGADSLKLDGRAGPMVPGNVAATPFDGSFNLQQVSIGSVQRFIKSEALAGMDGIVSGKGDIKNDANRLSANGNLAIEKGKIRGVDIGYPVRADFDLATDANSGLVRIEKGALKLGNTPVNISGNLQTKATPMQLDVKLNVPDASIAEVARLASAFGVAFNPRMQVTGRIAADVTARGAATSPQMQGSIRGRDLQMTGANLPKAVKVPSLDLALTPTTITSQPFSASAGSTTVHGSFALAQYSTPAATVQADVRTANANLGEALNILQALGAESLNDVNGTGTFDLAVHVAGPVKSEAPMTYSGSGKLVNGTLKVPALTRTIQVRNADLRFTANSAVLENLAASIGETNAAGAMTISNFANPQVQFNLRADKWNVREWQQMLASPQNQQRTGARWSLVPEAHAQRPAGAQDNLLMKARGTGTVAVGTIIFDQVVMNDANARVTLDRGTIRLDPVTARTFNGLSSGSVVIDMRPTPAAYTVNMKLDRADANQVLSSISSLKNTLYGMLLANANTSFTVQSADNIARALNGRVSLNLNDGKLANVDVLQQMASVAQFTRAAKAAEPFTRIFRMSGDFDIRNGVATTNNLVAQIDGGSVSGAGSIDLGAQALHMKVTAVLSKEFTDRVGGTGVGGFMQTALANQRGELVVPMIVSGTFAAPRFAPDMQKVAQMKLENLLPSASNPGQMTTGILGAIMGRRGQQQSADPNAPEGQQQPNQTEQALPQNDAAGALGGLIDALSNRKKKQQQQPQQKPPQ